MLNFWSWQNIWQYVFILIKTDSNKLSTYLHNIYSGSLLWLPKTKILSKLWYINLYTIIHIFCLQLLSCTWHGMWWLLYLRFLYKAEPNSMCIFGLAFSIESISYFYFKIFVNKCCMYQWFYCFLHVFMLLLLLLSAVICLRVHCMGFGDFVLFYCILWTISVYNIPSMDIHIILQKSDSKNKVLKDIDIVFTELFL